MGKWLNGARVRKREIDGKDTRIAALAAANAAQTAANAAQTAANASATKKTRCFRGAFRKIRRQALKQVPSHTQRGINARRLVTFHMQRGVVAQRKGGISIFKASTTSRLEHRIQSLILITPISLGTEQATVNAQISTL